MAATRTFTLALDQGSFSSRALVFDERGRLVHQQQQAVALQRLDQRRVQQDPEEILDSVRQVVDASLSDGPLAARDITAAGLATQRSSILAWRPSSGQTLSPVLSWQDTRAHRWLENFAPRAARIERITGLRLSPHYGVSKMVALLNDEPRVRRAAGEGDCVITPLASFILFHLCDQRLPVIDICNASRTLLCDLSRADWSEELLQLFGIEQRWLPHCRPVQADFGRLAGSDIPLRAVSGDQTAAMFDHGQPKRDCLRINLGTGAFAMMPVERARLDQPPLPGSGLLAGISRSDGQETDYFIEGTVNGAGAALDWLQQRYSEPLDCGSTAIIDNAAPDCLFINSVGGLGSPLWRDDIEPGFVDLALQPVKPEPASACLAVLESIVFLLQMNIERLRAIAPGIRRIETTGGLSRIDYINQALADLSGLPVARRHQTEATARGIAWLAAANRSQWENGAVDGNWLPRPAGPLRQRLQLLRGHLAQ